MDRCNGAEVITLCCSLMNWGHQPLKVSQAYESMFLRTNTNHKHFKKQLYFNMHVSRKTDICKSCWVLGSTGGVNVHRVFGTNN